MAQSLFPNFLEYSRFVHRCNALLLSIQLIRQALVFKEVEGIDVSIIDSFPIPLCQPIRNFRSKVLGDYANIGYNATFGYQKPMGGAGAYWGMEFGLGSRGFKADEMKCIAHNIQYSPFTFGWKIGVADNLSIDPHLGVFASYDYTSKMKESGESISWGDFADYLEVDYNHFDAGMNIGVGLWYDRFNLDFTYQRGFIDVFSDLDGIKTSNFMIRLGIAF